jgi:hypothetical protein
MSTPLISPSTLGDLIKRESDPDYTRETVTLKAGTAYPLGAVLGRITATGVYAFSPAASTTDLEGAEIASAVLLHPVDASDTDTQAVVLARGRVIVSDRALAFDASVTDASAKSIKHQQLAAHGIVVRAAV